MNLEDATMAIAQSQKIAYSIGVSALGTGFKPSYIYTQVIDQVGHNSILRIMKKEILQNQVFREIVDNADLVKTFIPP